MNITTSGSLITTSGSLSRVKLQILAASLLPMVLLAATTCYKNGKVGCGSKVLERCCLMCGEPVSCNVLSSQTYAVVGIIQYPPGGKGREDFESMPQFKCKWACTAYCYNHISPWPQYLSTNENRTQLRTDPSSPECEVTGGP